MHPYALEKLADHRARELRAEADHARLLALVRRRRPSKRTGPPPPSRDAPRPPAARRPLVSSSA